MPHSGAAAGVALDTLPVCSRTPVPSFTLHRTAALLNPRFRERHANGGTCVACLVVNGLAAVRFAYCWDPHSREPGAAADL